MASLSRAVTVTINRTSRPVTRAGFGTPLGVFQVDTSIFATRVASYASPQEMIDAGFVATDNAYQWASVVFSQSSAPSTVKIGRRVLGTAQVDTVTITLAAVGTWSLVINGVTFSYVAGASDTTTTIAEGLKAAIDAGDEPVNTSDVTASAFTVTADVAGEAFTNGGITPAGGGTGTFAATTPNSAAEDLDTTLPAIASEDPDGWYLLNIETRNDSDIAKAQSFITGRKQVAVLQSRDPDAIASTTPNIFATIQALNDPRVLMVWHDDDREYLDGGATAWLAASQMDQVNGAITLYGKRITGVPVDDLKDGEITSVAGDGEGNFGYGGNVHVSIGGGGFFLYGYGSDGSPFDLQLTDDWTEARMSEDIVGFVGGTPTKIPFTQKGINGFEGVIRGRMNIGVQNAHFDSFTITMPELSDVSAADKTLRLLQNIVVDATYAGAIHKVKMTINLGA